MITRVIIKNFKGIKDANIAFNPSKNIIVGNNGVGKTTIIEALSLALGYGLNKLDITPSLFHISAIEQFKLDKIPPEILVEVYFEEQKGEFSGRNNSLHELYDGLRLKISLDDDGLDGNDIKQCSQIPCEYYQVERYWFSDTIVKQRQMPYYVQIVDSFSNYFALSSNRYVYHLLKKYIGKEDTIKIMSSLRQLQEKFDSQESITEINKRLAQEQEKLSVSLDINSRTILQEILCPYIENIPVEQIGAGELCILKTMLSIDKAHLTDKPKIIIIEEPESHLSHTKMYELIGKIEENLKDTNTQLILTTHNSFVANQLDLSNLIIVENEAGNINTKTIKPTEKSLFSFFTKISNYPTLRLILCKSVILVEGPTEEMLITDYYYRTYNHNLLDDGIELLSVNGVQFKEYVNLVYDFQKKVAIITDNDSHTEQELLSQRGFSSGLPTHIRLFTEADTELHTLECAFVHRNKHELQSLSKIVRKQQTTNETEVTLSKFMQNNKTEWVFRLITDESEYQYAMPNYIDNAIKWIRGDSAAE